MIKSNKKTSAYVINDYLNKKRFCSFLPSIAGMDGKPLWAFYANVGQCLGGFGVNNKETPLTPFDSAFLAYSNIPLKGFRTFIEIDDKFYEPFSKPNNQTMIVERGVLTICETTNEYSLTISYTTIPHQSYPALLRKVKLVCNKNAKVKILDGLPIFLPVGVSNYEIHELTTLVAAYTEAKISDKYSWFKYTNRGGDDSKVVSKDDGSAFFSIDKNGKPLSSYIDMDVIFSDPSLRYVRSLNEIRKNEDKQVKQNKILGAFSYLECDANEYDGEIEFISLFGAFSNEKELHDIRDNISYKFLDKQFDETRELVDSLIPVVETNSPKLDEYIKQSFFDNGLRGGFPTIINDKPFYLYSRKHGDMERDYNAFEIPSTYFSSGYGNFRDVNQNRRNDLIIEPKVDISNIYLFFSLIEQNGFNPLLVDTKLLNKDFESFNDAENFISSINSKDIKAKYVEGYWIDHWVYNLDLLENYVSIYPDKLEELLNGEIYRFYDSGIRIKPRKERYEVNDKGIRQYSSLEKLNDVKEGWLLDNNNQPIKVNLASKILDLILKKFVTLDYRQMGLEMFANKPGWNDSLNGLPGVLGSSISESIELLRLTRFLKENIDKIYSFSLISASHILLDNILNVNSKGFELWNKMNELRERFEDTYRHSVELDNVNFHVVNLFLNKVISILNNGINTAISESKSGILPTYFINEVTKYHFDNGVVIDEFIAKPLPLFLEGPARLAKLGNTYFDKESINKVEASGLFDKKIKVFKTSESLEGFTKEIGRTSMFTPGWLERESDFLHMTFKYLIGLCYSEHYEEFFKYVKTNFPCFMDPDIYGRPTNENVSFIVSDMHPNKDIVGQGYYARLTGANTEVINMYELIFFGKEIFKYENKELELNIKPHIPLDLFKDDKLTVTLFKTKVTFHNEHHREYNEQSNIRYIYKSHSNHEIAILLREGKIDSLNIYID